MPLELKIMMDDAGQVTMSGPIENKILCYGLLEVARDGIAEHHANAAKQLVQPAGPLRFPPPPARGNGHG
jgi:hypothetical protein